MQADSHFTSKDNTGPDPDSVQSKRYQIRLLRIHFITYKGRAWIYVLFGHAIYFTLHLAHR